METTEKPETFQLQEFFSNGIVTEVDEDGMVRRAQYVRRFGQTHWLYCDVMSPDAAERMGRQLIAAAERARARKAAAYDPSEAAHR
jgi:hypothetical protein